MSAVMETGTPRLRSMFIDDVDAVIAIEKEVYSHGWTTGIFNDCIRVGYSCWVLEAEGAGIIGYGVMSVACGEAHILNVSVHGDYQRQGYGRRILNHLLDLARKNLAEAAFLEVRPSNRGAIHLYESEGFKQVGLRRDYYPATHGREDALVFGCPLSTANLFDHS